MPMAFQHCFRTMPRGAMSSNVIVCCIVARTVDCAAPPVAAVAIMRSAKASTFIAENSGLRRFPCLGHPQDLYNRRGHEDLAERPHPVASLLVRADTALAELIELVEAGKLELQGGTVAVARQRHQQPGVETVAAGRLDLAQDELDRALSVHGQHVVRKASQVHRVPPRCDSG